MPTQGNLYALLIGINDYECAGIRKLRFAVADVLALHGVLAERAGLDARNCFVLSHPASGHGPSPRRAEVLRALAQFSRAPMTPDDTFLLYFAGHGFTAGEKSYLLTVDSDPALPELLAETAVSLEAVNRFTRQIKAGQQLLILDACRNDPTTLGRSGGAACLDAAMARDIATLAREQPVAASGPRSARAILSACWEGQVSYEYPAQSHGWFSYNLLQSLRAHPTGWLDVAQMAEEVRQRMNSNAWRDLPEAVGQEPHVVVEGRPVRLPLATSKVPPAPMQPDAGTPKIVSISTRKELITPQGIKLTLIPAGEFLMGSPDSDPDAFAAEHPQHRIRVTHPFYLGVHPVTQTQYEALMGENPSYYGGEGDRPVDLVSWDDANAFCRKLSATLRGELEGYLCRLPTEAEWEYACRAGTTTHYCFGDDAGQLGEYAWFDENLNSTTHPVGQKRPNAWGLYDMHGNVSEWCLDWFDSCYYATSPLEDPQGPAIASLRVFRGGGWRCFAGLCRSAARGWFEPARRDSFLGFRVALVPAELGR